MRLFAKRGFDRVTVAEVTAAADVSQKTVYNYFPTKEDLFYDEVPQREASPAEQPLAGGAQGHVDRVHGQRPRPRLAQSEALQGEGRPDPQVHGLDFRDQAAPRGLALDAIPDRSLEGRGREPRGQEGGEPRGHGPAHPPARESHGG